MDPTPNNSDSKPTEKPEEKATENQPNREPNGHFAKGNKLGHRFTKDDQPENNPGRPKTRRLTDALLKHMGKKAENIPFVKKLAKSMGFDPKEISVEDVFVAAGIFHSMKGKGEYFKQVYNRIEGAVPKHLTLGGDDPVTVYLAMMKDRTAPKPEDNDVGKKQEAAADPAGDGAGNKGSVVSEVSEDVPGKGVQKGE